MPQIIQQIILGLHFWCENEQYNDRIEIISLQRAVIEYPQCSECLSSFNVCAQINLVRQLSDVHLEPVLHLVEDLGVALVTDEGDGQTLGSESASSGHSVQVGVGILGHVVVEDDVDSLDVHATTKQVGGHQDPLLEVLELLIPGQSLLLGHPSVDGDGGEVLFNEELSQSDTSLH